jgi:zinc protease
MAYTEKVDAQIEASTLEEVNAAIRKTLDPAKFLNVYAGDFAAAAQKP